MGNKPYEEGSNYILPRDSSELSRLNIQHGYILKMVNDGRPIYDRSFPKLGTGSRVLDSGTGTGAWILDVAKEAPADAELHGCDVSSNNFPRSHPPNVHFSVASATKLPTDWTGSFDLINQRLLMGGLLAMEWPIALSEYFRVLKPGGYVQFVELDNTTYINAGPECLFFRDCIRQLYVIGELMWDSAPRLPEMLGNAGFTDIVSEEKYGPTGRAWGEVGELGFISFGGAIWNMRSAMIAYGIIESEEEFVERFERLKEEWNRTDIEGMQYTYRKVCARKPGQLVQS